MQLHNTPIDKLRLHALLQARARRVANGPGASFWWGPSPFAVSKYKDNVLVNSESQLVAYLSVL